MATILGVLIFVGLIFSTVIPMYLIMKQADSLYESRKLEMSNLDQDRSKESLAVGVVPISQYSNVLNITVNNKCALVVKIIRIWINDTYSTASEVLQPMSVLSINSTVVTRTNSSFNIIVGTERGNLFAAETGTLCYGASGWDNGTVPEPPPGVKENGVFGLDWFYFKYTSYQKQSQTDAMTIPKSSTYVAIYFQITNNYPTKVKADSFVTWIVPYIDVTMSIVDHVNYPAKTITSYTNEINVQPGQTVGLVFAATAKKGSSWVWGSSIPSNLITDNPGGTAFVQLTLFYTLLNKTYCQTVMAQGTILT